MEISIFKKNPIKVNTQFSLFTKFMINISQKKQKFQNRPSKDINFEHTRQNSGTMVTHFHHHCLEIILLTKL